MLLIRAIIVLQSSKHIANVAQYRTIKISNTNQNPQQIPTKDPSTTKPKLDQLQTSPHHSDSKNPNNHRMRNANREIP